MMSHTKSAKSCAQTQSKAYFKLKFTSAEASSNGPSCL